jgi:hypothetical protein
LLSDIGGGNVGNSVNVSLAQITLRWMLEQVILSQCGIVFDEEALERVGMPLSSFPTPQTPSAAEDPSCESHLISDKAGPSATPEDVVSLPVEELDAPSPLPSTDPPTIPSQPNPDTCDALAPLFDELQLQKSWWLLEIMLLPFSWQDAHGKWHTRWR